MNINFSNEVLYPRTKLFCRKGYTPTGKCQRCKHLSSSPSERTYSPGDIFRVMDADDNLAMIIRVDAKHIVLASLLDGNRYSYTPVPHQYSRPILAALLPALTGFPMTYIGRFSREGVLVHGSLD
jgi:hypothetical protein